MSEGEGEIGGDWFETDASNDGEKCVVFEERDLRERE